MAKQTFVRDKDPCKYWYYWPRNHGKTTLTAALTMVLAKKGLSEVKTLTKLTMLLKKKKGVLH
jgi:elongation factor Tu